jgi:hypothetical protein
LITGPRSNGWSAVLDIDGKKHSKFVDTPRVSLSYVPSSKRKDFKSLAALAIAVWLGTSGGVPMS